jgi:hypothetical protein
LNDINNGLFFVVDRNDDGELHTDKGRLTFESVAITISFKAEKYKTPD